LIRIFLNFHEQRIDAHRDTGASQTADVFLSPRMLFLTARELQAVVASKTTDYPSSRIPTNDLMSETRLL